MRLSRSRIPPVPDFYSRATLATSFGKAQAHGTLISNAIPPLADPGVFPDIGEIRI